MKYINNIEDVIAFTPLTFHMIVYRSMNGNLFLYTEPTLNSITIFGRDSESRIYKYGDSILISRRIERKDHMTYDIVEYDITKSQSRVIVNDGFPLLITGSKLLVKCYGEFMRKVKQLDLEQNNKDWEIDMDFRPFLYSSDKVLGFIGRKKNPIFSISNKDGSVLWEHDLSNYNTWNDYDNREKKTEIQKVLGEYKEQLFIYLNNGRILILDIHTGDRLCMIENENYKEMGLINEKFGHTIELDQKQGKLIQLIRQGLIEIRLDEKSVALTPITDMETLNIERVSSFIFDEEYIYFLDQYSKKVGKLNRETKKIEWIYEFVKAYSEEEQRYARELKVQGDRLFVLDNKNTLHIFERDVLV